MNSTENKTVAELMEHFNAELEKAAAMTPEQRAEQRRQEKAREAEDQAAARRLQVVQRLGEIGQFPENTREWYLEYTRKPSDEMFAVIPTLRPLPLISDQEKPVSMLKGWLARAGDNLRAARGPWLIAPPGHGKTALLSAWANSLHAYSPRPLTMMYVNWALVIRQFQDKGSDFDSSGLGRALMAPDVLVWDEVGTKKDTLRSNGLAYDVLEYRGTRRKLTAVCSNYGPAELKKGNLFGPQELDRLVELCPKMYQCGWFGVSLRENPPLQLELVP